MAKPKILIQTDKIPIIESQLNDIAINVMQYLFLVTNWQDVNADWTLAIQTALNTGKPVYLPPRDFYVTNLTMVSDKQIIYSTSRKATLKSKNNSGAIITVSGNANEIRDLSFYAPTSNVSDLGFCAIKLDNSQHTKLNRIYTVGAFTYTLILNNAIYCTIDESYISGAKRRNIYIKNGTYTQILGSMIHNADIDNVDFESLIYCEDAPSVYISKCHVTRGKGHGIYAIANPTLFKNTYLVIDECDIDNLEKSGIYVDGYWNILINGNWVSASRVAGNDAVVIKNATQINVLDNSVYASVTPNRGMYLDNCKYGSVDGNLLNCHQTSIESNACTGITFSTNKIGELTARPEFGSSALYGFKDTSSTNSKWIDNIFNMPNVNAKWYTGILDKDIKDINYKNKKDIVLKNSWVNTSGTWARFSQYWIDGDYTVIQGHISSGTKTNGTILFTIDDINARPSTYTVVPCGRADGMWNLLVKPNGDVLISLNPAPTEDTVYSIDMRFRHV
jgi:hypothetical protein